MLFLYCEGLKCLFRWLTYSMLDLDDSWCFQQIAYSLLQIIVQGIGLKVLQMGPRIPKTATILFTFPQVTNNVLVKQAPADKNIFVLNYSIVFQARMCTIFT